MSSKISDVKEGSGGCWSCSSWFNLSSRLHVLELLKVFEETAWRLACRSSIRSCRCRSCCWIDRVSMAVLRKIGRVCKQVWYSLWESNSNQKPPTATKRNRPETRFLRGSQLSPSYTQKNENSVSASRIRNSARKIFFLTAWSLGSTIRIELPRKVVEGLCELDDRVANLEVNDVSRISSEYAR